MLPTFQRYMIHPSSWWMCAIWLFCVYTALYFEKEWRGEGDEVEASTSSGLVRTEPQAVAKMPILSKGAAVHQTSHWQLMNLRPHPSIMLYILLWKTKGKGVQMESGYAPTGCQQGTVFSLSLIQVLTRYHTASFPLVVTLPNSRWSPRHTPHSNSHGIKVWQ
jgi:hypothetical protein